MHLPPGLIQQSRIGSCQAPSASQQLPLPISARADVSMLSSMTVSNGRLRMLFNLCVWSLTISALGALLLKFYAQGQPNTSPSYTLANVLQVNTTPITAMPSSSADAGLTSSNPKVLISHGIPTDACSGSTTRSRLLDAFVSSPLLVTRQPDSCSGLLPRNSTARTKSAQATSHSRHKLQSMQT